MELQEQVPVDMQDPPFDVLPHHSQPVVLFKQ
jgi:hypothetical protein